tara:strand:+ start:15466 stop:17907 length:2442 start_codon:yes stop_codon:yes gene_type:complete
MASTLIIGIGSTGLKMIEHAQQYHYEFTGRNRPGGNVEYLFLETDINRKPAETASGSTDINDVYVSLESNAATINNLKGNKNVDSDWIPEASSVLSKGEGAGGLSSYGRLSTWNDTNLNIVKSKINSLYSKIGGNSETNIFVVGTLTGGTGSGLCVDIAYLIREITSCNNIYGMFLVPDRASFLTDKIVHENSLCALMSLKHYSSPKNNYVINWPHGELNGNQKPPYSYIHTLSTEFNGPNASMKSVAELFRTAGMMLCLNILDTDNPNQQGFTALLNARRVDKSSNDLIDIFYTTGFSVVQYPKTQIEELAAINIVIEELNKLVNAKNYIDKTGNKVPIAQVKNEIQRQKHKSIEDIIGTSLEDLNDVKGPDSIDLQSNIKICVSKLLKKNHGKPSNQKYIYDLFSVDSDHNFYSSLKNNISRSQDRMINEINAMVTDSLNQYKNFEVIQLVLESISNYIPKLLKFYETKYGLDGTDATWTKVLKRNIAPLLKNAGNFGLMGQKKGYLENELTNLVELVKLNTMHHLISEIQERIIDGKNFSTINGVKLANVKKVKSIISEINDNIQGDHAASLETRKLEIEGNLKNQSSCFNLVFRKGTWEKDYDEAFSNYKSSQNKININKILESNNLWSYFIQPNYHLYRDSMVSSIAFVKTNNFVGDADLMSIVKNLNDDTNKNKNILNLFGKQSSEIQKMLPSMSKIRSSQDEWHSHDKSPVYIIGNNTEELKQNLTDFNFKEDNSVNLPSLDNAVVFYTEYSYLGLSEGKAKVFNPIENMDYMKDVKDHLKNVLDEKFKLKRMPYLTVSDSKKYFN